MGMESGDGDGRARTIMPPLETSIGSTAIILRCSSLSNTALTMLSIM